MQSRVARLILLCLFLIAISTAAFLFWKGDTAATAGALDARSFDSSARIAQRAVLDLRAAQFAYAIAGQPADRSVAKVAQQLDAARTNIQALRAMTKIAEVTSALDAASTALSEFANPTSAPPNTPATTSVCWRRTWCSATASSGPRRPSPPSSWPAPLKCTPARLESASTEAGRLLRSPPARPRQFLSCCCSCRSQSPRSPLLWWPPTPVSQRRPIGLTRLPHGSRDPPLDEGIVSMARHESMGEPTAVELASGAATDMVEASLTRCPRKRCW